MIVSVSAVWRAGFVVDDIRAGITRSVALRTVSDAGVVASAFATFVLLSPRFSASCWSRQGKMQSAAIPICDSK